MLPLYDDVPHERPPLVVTGLIIANVLAFLWLTLLPAPAQAGAIASLAVTPAVDLRGLQHGLPSAAWPFVTSLFLHGSWLHLGGNMLFLHIFGDNVEDRLGHAGFLLFYLLTGCGASLCHALMNPASHLPSLGASGAIAGVLAAYWLFYPRARVFTLVFLGIFVTTVRLPAAVYLPIWFALQALMGLVSLGSPDAAGGVAYWAHIGGFALGLVLAKLMQRPPGWRRHHTP